MSTRSRRRPKSSPSNVDARDELLGSERLQKVLASAGVASRRQCELLITEGRVEVDGQVVTELGVRVDPQNQEIVVDGEKVAVQRHLYYMVNKPTGVVATNSDPQGRPRVVDYIDTQQRLFTIGRLDMSSEGLLLVTNDGQLANRLTHPRYEVEKTYLVEVAGQPSGDKFRQLIEGVRFAEGVARVARLHVKRRFKRSTEIEIVLKEGRNREIRRLLARIGHKVLRLKRVAMGPIKLGDLPTGAHRQLTSRELQTLRSTGGKSNKRPSAKRSPAKWLDTKQTTTKRPTTKRASGAGRTGSTPRKKKAAVKGRR